jgi:CHAT domain-containing protein
MEQMPWRNPMVDLLVLSACRTAVGDAQAELGFAGVALQSGVKSALASLWYVDDLGTLALMGEFYGQLPRWSTKGEALRQAQLSLLQGNVNVRHNTLSLSQNQVNLPNGLKNSSMIDFRHPRYWAAFTLISSPW